MSDYKAITTYLFGLQRFGIKLGLDNIKALLNAIGNPQNKWQSIHIAGTNGKGSTAAMLESILIEAGYRVGLYTSPHLVDFTERIRINRATIPQNEVIEFTLKIKPLVEQIQPSFFEVTTAMAFWYFAKEKIDLAILETGLGGRLDSTNVVNPLITAITPIDFDHQKYLGNTIEKIAQEKAGVLKPGVPCVTNNRNKRICEVIRNKCADAGAKYINIFDVCFLQINSSNLEGISFDFRYSNFSLKNLALNLCGEYQVDNAALALGTVLNLKNKINITEKNIYDGLKDVLWRGRIDLVSRKPNIVIDVSHNSSGFEKTLSFINQIFP
ncbi:MAG: bifunctional folylpolyglutamate synthase/dihydrofolate synthase, partial [Calditrichia bacterium]